MIPKVIVEEVPSSVISVPGVKDVSVRDLSKGSRTQSVGRPDRLPRRVGTTPQTGREGGWGSDQVSHTVSHVRIPRGHSVRRRTKAEGYRKEDFPSSGPECSVSE